MNVAPCLQVHRSPASQPCAGTLNDCALCGMCPSIPDHARPKSFGRDRTGRSFRFRSPISGTDTGRDRQMTEPNLSDELSLPQ
eukprot:6707916-Pyramimonas_sp.AAC.1